MVTQKRKTGDAGEDLAAEYLTKNGYKIIERNHWRPWGEIDIVAEKDKILYFIEVKTLVRYGSIGHFGGDDFDELPEANVTPAKQKKLKKIIATYLNAKNVPEETNWQIDIIGVILDRENGNARINHLKNAVFGEN